LFNRVVDAIYYYEFVIVDVISCSQFVGDHKFEGVWPKQIAIWFQNRTGLKTTHLKKEYDVLKRILNYQAQNQKL